MRPARDPEVWQLEDLVEPLLPLVGDWFWNLFFPIDLQSPDVLHDSFCLSCKRSDEAERIVDGGRNPGDVRLCPVAWFHVAPLSNVAELSSISEGVVLCNTVD